MKGTLHKTESGWQVWYHAKEDLFYGNTGVRILPLLQEDAAGLFIQDTDNKHDGQEVDFEIIEIIKYPNPPHNPTYHSIDVAAKLLDKWITMKEGDITVNFKPMPEFDDPKYPDYPTRAQQLHIQIAEECFRKYPNNKELYTTDELIDAYKAGVIDGLKEWTLDIYDRPKYPEVKIICPRCKALMPCECNPPRQTSLLNSIRTNSSWDTIIREFHLATQQVPIGAPPLIFECWLAENYNPPTKKQE
jgi:hypothetical protein